ncbi:MAG: hypothetical protein ACPG7F_12115 [Aggregatilineales bacterium]
MVQTRSAESHFAEMNDIWKSFLHQRVNSFVKWDLVRFFHDNPHTADTAEHIARSIGRDLRNIEQELSGLAEAGILDMRRMSGLSIYRLSTEEETRKLIKQFVAACYNRNFREQAIHVIHSMSVVQAGA